MSYKNNILELRNKGYTYDQIVNELHCSKGTVSYYCGTDQKNKTLYRNERIRYSNLLRYLIGKKVSSFKIEGEIKQSKNIYKVSYKLRVRIKCLQFCNVQKIKDLTMTPEDILKRLVSNPNCELTGRPLDIQNTHSWHLDHIIPRSKGGSNTLDNCQIVCRQANVAKSNLLPEEFLQLCNDVIKHQNLKQTLDN